MKQSLFQEKYPVFTVELNKDETTGTSVDALIDFLKARIAENPNANYIGIFDHYAHTRSLPEGEIAPEILDAKNLLFCFGTRLPNAAVLAVRPRSIGIAELADKFVITFMEAPMPAVNQTIENWIKSLKNR